MMIDRRLLLAGFCASASPVLAAAPPKLGLIYPGAGGNVSPEAKRMYPTGIDFIATGVGLGEMTPEGYESVVDKIAPAAKMLAGQGAQGIAVMGTSLTFYKGAAFNREITRAVERASGLKAVTMSTAVIEGLRTMGAKRVAVATAYNDVVNARLRTFLTEEGFEVVSLEGLGVVAFEDINKVTQPMLFEFSAKVAESSPGADALLVSCGGLRTLDLLAPLEQRLKLPVVSSMPHAFWAGARLMGGSGRSPGFGRLLSRA